VAAAEIGQPRARQHFGGAGRASLISGLGWLYARFRFLCKTPASPLVLKFFYPFLPGPQSCTLYFLIYLLGFIILGRPRGRSTHRETIPSFLILAASLYRPRFDVLFLFHYALGIGMRLDCPNTFSPASPVPRHVELENDKLTLPSFSFARRGRQDKTGPSAGPCFETPV